MSPLEAIAHLVVLPWVILFQLAATRTGQQVGAIACLVGVAVGIDDYFGGHVFMAPLAKMLLFPKHAAPPYELLTFRKKAELVGFSPMVGLTYLLIVLEKGISAAVFFSFDHGFWTVRILGVVTFVALPFLIAEYLGLLMGVAIGWGFAFCLGWIVKIVAVLGGLFLLGKSLEALGLWLKLRARRRAA